MIVQGFADASATVYLTAWKKGQPDVAAAAPAAAPPQADLSTRQGNEALHDLVAARHDSLRRPVAGQQRRATWGALLDDYPESAFDKLWNINVSWGQPSPWTRSASCWSSGSPRTLDDPAGLANIG